VRYFLDVMRIKKNVCDNIIGTLLNITGKTKDGVKARKKFSRNGYMQAVGTRAEGTKYIFTASMSYFVKKREDRLMSVSF